MRNKQALIDDAEKYLKPELLEEFNVVEDAAHALHHSSIPVYTIGGLFTKSSEPVTFLFRKINRPSTDPDNFPGLVEDFEYIGRDVEEYEHKL